MMCRTLGEGSGSPGFGGGPAGLAGGAGAGAAAGAEAAGGPSGTAVFSRDTAGVAIEEPLDIVDAGCGIGNSTLGAFSIAGGGS